MPRRSRHVVRLVCDFIGFAIVNRVWWLLPMMALLAILTVFVVVGQAVAPYTLYTVF